MISFVTLVRHHEKLGTIVNSADVSHFPLGAALVPYGLPCIRELFRFLISLTNPLDRHNSEVMIHMGLQLLTVALESAPIANCQSLLGLVKEELCRHLFQVSLTYASAGFGTGELDTDLDQMVYWSIASEL